MKNRKLAILFVAMGTLIAAQSVFAQRVGYPPFGSVQVGNFDGINLQDLNVNFSIPVITSSGRGINFQLPIVYNSLVWNKYSTVWSPSANFGWQTNLPQGQFWGGLEVSYQFKCYNPGPGWFWATHSTYGGYAYIDPAGTVHSFPISFVIDTCWGFSGTQVGYAVDGSGYYGYITANGSYVLNVIGPAGTAPSASSIIDTNGNYITQTVNGSETDYTDSVGRKAAKVITNTSTIQYEFLDGTGTNTYKTATLTLTSTSIKTNFACSGVTEYAGSAYLPTELDIPTPSGTILKYLFAYEPTPQNSGYYTGRLQKVTLPTGGTYEYDYGATNDGVSCTDGSIVSMTRKVTDGTTTGTWQYVRNVPSLTTTVTDAVSNDTVYTFNSSGLETERQMYSGTGGSRTIQRTIYTTWATNGTPATSVVMLEDNSTQSETDTTFDSNGLLDSMTEYDWGAGAHGAALRTTTLSYLNTSNYTTRNIINRVTSKVVKDGSGTIKYRQDAAYDGATITTCPTGVPQHDDTNHGCSMNYRGNPTSITTYLDPVTPAQGIVTGLTYDVFGNVLLQSVSGTQQSQFNFSSTTQYAYPDSIVSGPSSGTQLTQSFTYKADTGLVATSKDPNNQQTTFAYDFLRRATSVTRPDNSQVTYGYDDTNLKVTVTTPIDSGRSLQQITAFDPLGLPYTSTIEDSTNTVYSIAQTNYDAMGRAYRTSNPYTGSPSYWTTTYFDALSRPYQVKLQDNSTIGYSYSTNTVTATDPAGKQRKSVMDGAGRLQKIFEPDVTNGNSLTVETDYTYTVLDSLAKVTQGAQTRTYTYDALGRFASVASPEAGTVCYGTYSGSTCQQNGYDNSGNLLSRTDTRGVVTSYAYDSLNRLIGISYPTVPSGVSAMPNTICNPVSGSANSNVCFYYDQGGSSAFALGRLTKMVDPSGSATYTYNNLGETTNLQKVIGSNTYTTQYAYNTGAELTQITYPSGHNVYQSYDAIGRLCEVSGSTISSACGTTTSPYASALAYNTTQQVTGLNYGNGVAASLGYSSDRLQMNSISYAKSGTTLFGLTYSYSCSGNNNGQICGITDSVDNGRSATYTYDALARLSTAVTPGSTNYPKWGLSFTYDRYGNRTAETQTAGNPPSNSVAVSATTNQITTSGYSYDLSGNMTNDGYNTLVYDGEDRTTSASNSSASATYAYDGNGNRIQKAVHSGTTTVYIYSGGGVVAEYDNGAAPSAPSREYIYTDGQLTAKNESGSTIYYLQDHLSNRVITSASGNVTGQEGHYPFGENWYTSTPITKWEFTTYERDAETDPAPHYGDGNDYAMSRSYVDRLARFASADPVDGSTADPQSLDHYSYVEDDPINLTDPTGLCPQGHDYVPAGQNPNKPEKAYCIPVPMMGFGIFGWYSQDYTLGAGEGCCTYVNISGPTLNGAVYTGTGDQTGGGGSNLQKNLMKIIKAACAVVPDAVTAGVGGDIGLGITFGAEGGLVANGASGEVSLFSTGTTSIGFIGPDFYGALGIAKNSPTNGALNSNGKPSYGGAFGIMRTGVQATSDSFQGTYGLSLTPVTAAFQASFTNVSKTSIPYLGYLLHPPRAVCKALIGK